MRTVAVLLAVLALSGCASELPKAATAADREAFVSRQLDAEWKNVGIEDSQRPDVKRVRFITNAEFTDVMAQCTTTLGPGYSFVLSDEQTAARLVYYACQAQYPVDPSEYLVLSTAQIDYLYDYYRRWTIPCIHSHGYDVGVMPSRTEFRLFNGLWDPIYHNGSHADLSEDAYRRVTIDCGVGVVSKFPTK